jgi:hypothetical protein
MSKSRVLSHSALLGHVLALHRLVDSISSIIPYEVDDPVLYKIMDADEDELALETTAALVGYAEVLSTTLEEAVGVKTSTKLLLSIVVSGT